MASLTTRNITKTSADLANVSIDSPESLTLIPSIHLIQELSTSLGTKLENLNKILELNEIKWLGVSTTDPTSGYITINGIRYNNEDIDNGNYVTYTVPDTSVELKYIYGHGTWDTIGDVVNLPDNFILNKHVNREAAIDLEKIAGLNRADLQNESCEISDVANLRTTLCAMIRDYKRFDINTVFSEISGNISNTINLQIGENAQNLTMLFNTQISGVSGDIYNTINTDICSLVGDFNMEVSSLIKDISGNVNQVNQVTANIVAQIANVNSNLNSFYENIQGNISSLNDIVLSVEAVYADINNAIETKMNNIVGDIVNYSYLYSHVTAVVANISNTIATEISDSTIGTLNMINTINSTVEASCAAVRNDIQTWVTNSFIDNLTLVNTINSSVSAVSATVTNSIGTTFNACNIGTIASYDESFYNELGSYSMRYCGEYGGIEEASRQITASTEFTKTITVPHYNEETGEIETQEQEIPFKVNKLDKGCVVAIGDVSRNGPYELCVCIDVPLDRSSADAPSLVKWAPFVDDRIFIKKSAIKVVADLPEDEQLEDEMFYVVVDPE